MKFQVCKFNKDSLTGFSYFLKYTPRNSPEFNYIFDRWLRDITLRNQHHQITDLLKEVLIKYDLYNTDFMNMNEMRRINRKLKQLGYKSKKSPIMLEHWKTIKNMRNEILEIDNNLSLDDYLIELQRYLEKNVQCFFKLTEKEWNLQNN